MTLQERANRCIRLILASFLLTVVGAGPVYAQAENVAPQGEISDSGEVVAVTTRPLSEVWFEQTLQVSAEVLSLNHPQISAQGTGEVLAIEVETGDLVEKGALLVRLDCRQPEFSLAVASDAYALALKEFERSRSLQKKNAIAEQQMTQASSTYEQARIRKEQAALAVEHCLIKAPFAGIVSERQVQLGAIAVPGSPVLKLLQTDAVEVRARLNSTELSSIRETSQIQFISEGSVYPLRLRSVIPVVDSVSNKRAVRLSFEGQLPFPGSPGDVVWHAPGKYLPVSLIVQRQGSLGYFVNEAGVARFVALPDAQLGHPARVDHFAQQAGSNEVIIEGRYRIEEGGRVKATAFGS